MEGVDSTPLINAWRPPACPRAGLAPRHCLDLVLEVSALEHQFVVQRRVDRGSSALDDVLWNPRQIHAGPRGMVHLPMDNGESQP